MSEEIRKDLEKQIDTQLEDMADYIIMNIQDNLTKPMAFESTRRPYVRQPSIISNTGELARSIERDYKFLEKTIKITAPWATEIEYGSSPHIVPVNSLRKWAMLKLRLGQRAANSAAYAIQNTIAKYGTDPRPFVRSALMEAEVKFGTIEGIRTELTKKG